MKILGRLRYRTSYGQNVLKHTLEVVHLGGIMAAELKAGVKTTKRAALLHDLGKAMTHEVEGSHAVISAQLARRYGESEGVVHAIEAHHYEVQPQTVEAVLLIAADAVSASRPGARGESLENYIRRLEALEEIATGSPASRRRTRSRRGARSASSWSRARSTTTARCCSRTRSRARSRTSSSTRARSRSSSSASRARSRSRSDEHEAAARRWAEVWSRAWPAADVDAIAALYADGAIFYSHPFRERQTPRDYVAWAFAEQAEAECRFGEPVVGGDRAAVDWWAVITATGRLRGDDRRNLAPAFRCRRPRGRAARRLGGASPAAASSPTGPAEPEPAEPGAAYDSRLDAALPRHDVRLPDERSRLRAHQGHARVARAGRGASPETADVLVFNTCTIREKPDKRLAAYLGNAGARKRERPDLVIAVGGCYAEAQRERIFELYPFVDVAFGPGSIPHLGDWIAAGGYAVPRGQFGTHEHFAADLPMHRERRFQAWVQVSMGCNSVVRVLHRPGRPGAGAEPAARARSWPR